MRNKYCFIFELILAVFLPQNSVVTSVRVLNPPFIVEGYTVAIGTVILDISRDYQTRVLVVDEVDGDDMETNIFNDYFSVADTGIIRTRRLIDRDAMAIRFRRPSLPVFFNITLFVNEATTYMLLDTVKVNLRISDVNNNVPVFQNYENRAFSVSFSEGGGWPRIARLPRATDNDEGTNSVQSYTLSSTFDGLFMLSVRRTNRIITDVQLTLTGNVDAEVRTNYSVSVTAGEGNSNPRTATLRVIITIEDVCDVTPMFLTTRYNTNIREDARVGSVVLTNILAIDMDAIDAGQLRYQITEMCTSRYITSTCESRPLSESPFNHSREDGQLRLSKSVDRERVARYELSISAVDTCQRRDTVTVSVTIEDINDNAPGLIIAAGSTNINEDRLTGSNFLILKVNDTDYGMDTPRFSALLYDMSTGTLRESDFFRLNVEWPYIDFELVRSLDRENTSHYSLVVNVTDWGTPNISILHPLNITVIDVNDNPPVFQPYQQFITMEEELPHNTRVVHLSATDRDIEGNGQISYLLPPSNASFPYQGLFMINGTGLLLTKGRLDKEQQESLTVLVEARDNPSPNRGHPLSDFAVVNIRLIDINDIRPTFPSSSAVVRILEDRPINTLAFMFTASDSDTEMYSNLHYSLTPRDSPFQINSVSGRVILVSLLDYEITPRYDLTLSAYDGKWTGAMNITVLITDVNENGCMFDRRGTYTAAVVENQAFPNHLVINVDASDTETPVDQLRFGIVAGNEHEKFRINDRTGEIFLIAPLDRERVSSHSLRISCSDGVELPSKINVTVQVIDENDNSPVFIDLPYNGEVRGNSLAEYLIYGVNVTATDADFGENGTVFYRLAQNDENHFRIDRRSGQISATPSLDFGSTMMYSFDIIAFDGGRPSQSSMASVTITIHGLNRVAPVFTNNIPDSILVDMDTIQRGQALYTVTAVDEDPDSHLRFYFKRPEPDCFSINDSTGEIHFNRTRSCTNLTRESESEYYTIIATVMVSDGSRTASKQINFQVHHSLVDPLVPHRNTMIVSVVPAVVVSVALFLVILTIAAVIRAKKHLNTTKMQSTSSAKNASHPPPTPHMKVHTDPFLPKEKIKWSETRTQGTRETDVDTGVEVQNANPSLKVYYRKKISSSISNSHTFTSEGLQDSKEEDSNIPPTDIIEPFANSSTAVEWLLHSKERDKSKFSMDNNMYKKKGRRLSAQEATRHDPYHPKTSIHRPQTAIHHSQSAHHDPDSQTGVHCSQTAMCHPQSAHHNFDPSQTGIHCSQTAMYHPQSAHNNPDPSQTSVHSSQTAIQRPQTAMYPQTDIHRSIHRPLTAMHSPRTAFYHPPSPIRRPQSVIQYLIQQAALKAAPGHPMFNVCEDVLNNETEVERTDSWGSIPTCSELSTTEESIENGATGLGDNLTDKPSLGQRQ